MNTAPVDRQYRVYAEKDANNTGYSTSFTLTDLFEQVKPGFAAWLTDDYVENFDGTQPQTQGDLIGAFALYESLPTAVIKSSLQEIDGTHKLVVEVTLDKELTDLYYQWEYLDTQNNTWTSLTTETGSRIDVTDLDVLNGGADVRCKVFNDNDNLLAVSNILNVDNSLDVLKTSVTVIKKWAGYLTEKPSSVTVHLYKNDEEEGTAELNAGNGWTYVFDALPYHDEDGAPYEYTVSEDAVEGFQTTISDRTVIADPGKGTHYLASGALPDNASYALVSGGYLVSGNGSLSVTAANTTDSVTYDGLVYTSEVTNVPAEGGAWTVTANSDGTYSLRCGSSYLAMGSDGKLSLSSTTGTSFSIDENGHISSVVGGKTRYLKINNQGISSSDKSNEASVFAFYKAINVLGAYDRYEYEITNTGEVPNETSVTVTKKWVGSKTGRPDSVTVRLSQNGTALQDAVATLNANNGWAYVFDSLPYCDEDGEPYEYTVSEDPVEGFHATISDITVIQDPGRGAHYLSDGSILDGALYALAGGGYVISGNGSISGTAADISTDVIYDGVSYASELTNVPAEGGTWTVTCNSDGTYTFRCGTYYLAMNKDGNLYLSTETVSSPATTNFRIDDAGRISGIVGDKSSTKYIKITLDKGSFKSLSGTDNSGDATLFACYKAVDVQGAHDRYEYKITNRSSAEPQSPTVQYNKYIDYLGDKDTNPDTTLTNDFYRQYLDVEVSGDVAYDFLFVVDNTSSMLAKDLDGKNAKQRDQIVSEVLNGADNTNEGLLTQILRANPDNKIAVATFCGRSSQDKTYNQMLATDPEVHTVLDWCGIESTTDDIAPYVDVLYKDGGGTCYAAGLLWAEEMMQDPVVDDGNAKIVIFLGDGEPNGVLLNRSGNVASQSELDDKDSIHFNWGQIGTWSNYIKMCVDGTVNAMSHFLGSVEGMEGPGQEQVELYTIAVGTDFDDEILQTMADMGMGKRYRAGSIEDVNDAFTSIISRYLYTNFVITDNLSEYAEVYKDQLDLKVTRVADDQESVIWQGEWDSEENGMTGSAINGGESYIESVTFTEPTSEDSTGTIKVIFQPYYIMEPGVKYVLSYNLKATETAVEKYKETAYGGTVGDAKTDYPGNKSSSGKSGFHSNQSATVTYKNGNTEEQGLYPHPVIQVKASSEIITPEPPPEIELPKIGDTGVTLEKQIDWLGDTIPGMEDLYRLYLNLDVDAWPIDVLLVLDQSTSMTCDLYGNETMKWTWDFDEESFEPRWERDPDNPNKSRHEIVMDFLNGTKNDHSDGFIHQFHASNAGNNLAIMTFDSDSSIDQNYIYKWGDEQDYLELEYPMEDRATNYMAALDVANQIWALHPDKDNDPNNDVNHQKVMIFLSDGVPTIAYSDGHLDGGEERQRIGYGSEYNVNTITEAFEWYLWNAYYDAEEAQSNETNQVDENRRANPYYDYSASLTYHTNDPDTFPVVIDIEDLVISGIPGINEYPYGEFTNYGADFINWCDDVWNFDSDEYSEEIIQEELAQWLQNNVLSLGAYYDLFWLSENCFADFVDANEDVVTYSIGFTSDLNGTLFGRDRSEVLKYMGGYDDAENPGNFFYCESEDMLHSLFNRIAGVKDIKITDPLSTYVELTDAPDLRIDMKLGKGENEMSYTLYEDGAFTNIGETYLDTDATGFGSDGRKLNVVFKPDIVFFDRVYCEASFDVQPTVAAHEEWATNGYTVEGDENTDYGDNETSSGKPGLYSNNHATVEWDHDGEHEKEYPKPVVQVEENRTIRLAKSSTKDRTLVLGGAGFDLYVDCDEDDSIAVAIPGLSGKFGVKVNTETLVTKQIADNHGQLNIPNLSFGHYYLVETVTPNGFTPLEAPVEFDLNYRSINTSSEYAVVTAEDPLLITVLNESWYELPETGGAGTTLYTLGGLVLMISTLMYGFMLRRKRERRTR